MQVAAAQWATKCVSPVLRRGVVACPPHHVLSAPAQPRQEDPRRGDDADENRQPEQEKTRAAGHNRDSLEHKMCTKQPLRTGGLVEDTWNN